MGTRSTDESATLANDRQWSPVEVRREAGVTPPTVAEFVYRRPMREASCGDADVRLNGRLHRNADGWTARTNGLPRAATAGSIRDERRPLRDPRILIVDDCTLHRESLAAAFAANDSVPPGVAWDLPSLFIDLTEHAPNLVLINLDTRDSAMLLQAIFEVCPNMRVIVMGISEDDESAVVACAEAGVAGYHLRSESLDDLLALIGRVADGESSCSPRVASILLRRLSALAADRQSATKELVLTSREVQILRMLEMGLSNRDIAERLCIAVHTVKNHVHSVLTKLEVGTRAEAAALFRTVRFTETEREN